MGAVMQEIMTKVKEGGVQLIDHTTSLLHVIATNVHGIHLSKANEIMHSDKVFHCINDGLRNLVHGMKDWYEMMLEHENIRKEKVHEWKKKQQKIVCTYPPF